MLPRYCFLLMLLAFSMSSPAWGEDPCEKLPKPAVVLQRINQPLVYNFDYGYQSLNNIGQAIAGQKRQILGLTVANAAVTFSIGSSSYIDRSGRYECISPQIKVLYGFNPITVFVAKEFPQGSCAHQQIYEHEMRHVQAYQSHLDSVEKNITEALNARFATGQVWRGLAGEQMPRLQRELDTRWLPAIQRQIREVEAQQQLIDTPEEYERVANSCNGEIKQRIR